MPIKWIRKASGIRSRIYSHLRYSAIVPNIPMVGEAVGHISVEYENVKQ